MNSVGYESSSPMTQKRPWVREEDGSIAATQALKRLKVDDKDDFILSNDDDDSDAFDFQSYQGGGDDQSVEDEEDAGVSLASASSVDSTPPPPPSSRATTAHLSLDDYPLTPKSNNRSRVQHGLGMFLPRSLSLPQPQQPPPPQDVMNNAFLGSLHQEQRRRHRSTDLLNGMDALHLETSTGTLFLPTLSPSSDRGRRWHVKLRTDSKVE